MSQLENDCLSILSYVSQHRGEYQTYRNLSKSCNIPLKTIHRIITWHFKYGENNSVLFKIATKYGYDIKVFRNRPGVIIDVIDRGLDENSERWGTDFPGKFSY